MSMLYTLFVPGNERGAKRYEPLLEYQYIDEEIEDKIKSLSHSEAFDRRKSLFKKKMNKKPNKKPLI